MEKWKKPKALKGIGIVFAIIIAILSFTKITAYTSNPQNHDKEIQILDEKKATVLRLTAMSTASATTISALPGDMGSPIANKLADLSTYFLIVLCAIFLEKYLLTITGLAAFKVLIPVACLAFVLWILTNKRMFWNSALKLLIFGIVLYTAIPISISISKTVEDTYRDSLQVTLENADRVNKEIGEATEEGKTEPDTIKQSEPEAKSQNQSTNSVQEDAQGVSGFLGKVTQSFTGAKETAETVIENVTETAKELATPGMLSQKVKELTTKAEQVLNNFIEAVAVMIITSCVIPILVFVFFAWLVKAFFHADFTLDPEQLKAFIEKKA